MTSSLSYGIELEMLSPITMVEVARRLKEAGIACEAEGYNHETRNHWKIVTDGSITGSGHAMELVSPVLNGEEGFNKIRIVTRVLNSLGASVNTTTGFHVHIGVGPQPLDFFKRLAAVYAKFEPTIDSIMPNSRRENNNGYCRSMSDFSAKINQFSTIGQLERFNNHDNRYYKLNFASHWKYGTVEFRQHSGTLNSFKIINWINICQKMVQTALDKVDIFQHIEPEAPAAVTESPRDIEIRRITQIANSLRGRGGVTASRNAILALLNHSESFAITDGFNCRRGGATAESINLAAGGIVNLVGILEGNNIPFIRVRNGRSYRYMISLPRGEGSNSETTISNFKINLPEISTIETMSAFICANAAETAYLEARAGGVI